jgi:tetratricopeptide (TPR) repeat protein
LILSVLAVRIYLLAHVNAPIRSVAVLPLANLSNSPEQEYFADGMTEALITDLAKIAQLRVISLLIIHDPAERTRQATEAARRALELDSSLGEAHTALAMVNIYDYQWAAAEREFRKAIELSPNYPLAHDSYAMFLAFMGRFDESRVAAAKALDLDPLSPLVHLHVGACEFSMRRWDKGIEHFRKVFEVDPTSPWEHGILAEVYASRKMYPEALKEYRLAQYLPQQPDCEWKACGQNIQMH